MGSWQLQGWERDSWGWAGPPRAHGVGSSSWSSYLAPTWAGTCDVHNMCVHTKPVQSFQELVGLAVQGSSHQLSVRALPWQRQLGHVQRGQRCQRSLHLGPLRRHREGIR